MARILEGVRILEIAEQIRAADPDIVYVRGTGQGEPGLDTDAILDLEARGVVA